MFSNDLYDISNAYYYLNFLVNDSFLIILENIKQKIFFFVSILLQKLTLKSLTADSGNKMFYAGVSQCFLFNHQKFRPD